MSTVAITSSINEPAPLAFEDDEIVLMGINREHAKRDVFIGAGFS